MPRKLFSSNQAEREFDLCTNSYNDGGGDGDAADKIVAAAAVEFAIVADGHARQATVGALLFWMPVA